MNLSVAQKDIYIMCQIGGTAFVTTKVSSEKLLINHIFAMAFAGILIIPTILLNGIAILTILKSSQLNSKPCYFIILVQSVIDLAVGILGIPLFLFVLASGIGGVSNCFVASLAFKSAVVSAELSIIILTALTLERYVAILHPYAYITQVTKKRLLKYISAGAVVVFTVFILPKIFQTPELIRSFLALHRIFAFFFTVFAYTRIYLVVKKLARSPNQLHDAVAEQNMTRMRIFFRQIKQAKECFIVVLCFAGLHVIPKAIAAPLYGTLDKIEYRGFIIWFITPGMLNSSVNSVIFFWAKTMLRKEAVKMFN